VIRSKLFPGHGNSVKHGPMFMICCKEKGRDLQVRQTIMEMMTLIVRTTMMMMKRDWVIKSITYHIIMK